MQMIDLLPETLVIKGREHGGTLLVSVHEVFPVNPEFNSILPQGFNSMHGDIFKAIARYFGKHAYLLPGGELDEKIDATLVSAR